MANWEAYKDQLASIRREWDRAEEDIKLAEQIGGKVVYPSVAELRYGGRRLIEALHEIDKGASYASISALFQDAEFDCHRARHDAIDSATATIGVELKIIASKIGYDVILQCHPEFPKLVADLNNVRDKIAISRKNRSDREAIYSTIEAADFQEIVESYRNLMASEEMMKSMARRRRWERVINYGIGVLGLILAGIAVTLQLM